MQNIFSALIIFLFILTPHKANAISPGPFPSLTVQENKFFIKELIKKVPLGRIGNPKDLIGPIVFLASKDSNYITGQNLVVDGGWTIK